MDDYKKLTDFPVRFKLADPSDEYSPLVAGNAYPDAATPDGALTRTRPLPTVQDIKNDFLFGIPLASILTRQPLPDSVIESKILSAIADFEAYTQIPTQEIIKEHVFDFRYEDSLSFNPIPLPYKPITAIYQLGLQTSGKDLVHYPTRWCETSTPISGVIRVVPLFGIYPAGLAVQAGANGNYTYIPYIVSQKNMWPNLWKLVYGCGFRDGCLPYNIYEYIGSLAALMVLSMLSPITFPVTSTSLGIDGLSQGVSGPGPQWLEGRIQDLANRAQSLLQNIVKQYGAGFTLEVLG